MTHQITHEEPDRTRSVINTEPLPSEGLTEVDPEQYATQLGIVLHCEYNATEAAKLCRIGVNILRAAKNRGELDYLEAGKKKYRFLGVDLIKWKLQKRRIGSANTTSSKTDKVNGVGHGTTPRLDKDALQALALATFSRQKQR